MKTMLRTIMHNGQQCYALMFNCPGCEEFGFSGIHLIPVNICSPDKMGWRYQGDFWDFNNDLHHPTLLPSLVTTFEKGQKCHAMLENGYMRYLGDSTHSLKGMIVPLPDIPEEYL